VNLCLQHKYRSLRCSRVVFFNWWVCDRDMRRQKRPTFSRITSYSAYHNALFNVALIFDWQLDWMTGYQRHFKLHDFLQLLSYHVYHTCEKGTDKRTDRQISMYHDRIFCRLIQVVLEKRPLNEWSSSCSSSSNNDNKNSSGDEIANVNFYAVRPEATRIRWNNAK